MSNKLDIFTNKHIDTQLSISGQKEIQKLLEKDIFKVIILNKIIISKGVLNSTQVFHFSLVDNIKDLCNDKACKKSCLVAHIYNNEKENRVLMHLPKILEVS